MGKSSDLLCTVMFENFVDALTFKAFVANLRTKVDKFNLHELMTVFRCSNLLIHCDYAENYGDDKLYETFHVGQLSVKIRRAKYQIVWPVYADVYINKGVEMGNKDDAPIALKVGAYKFTAAKRMLEYICDNIDNNEEYEEDTLIHTVNNAMDDLFCYSFKGLYFNNEICAKIRSKKDIAIKISEEKDSLTQYTITIYYTGELSNEEIDEDEYCCLVACWTSKSTNELYDYIITHMEETNASLTRVVNDGVYYLDSHYLVLDAQIMVCDEIKTTKDFDISIEVNGEYNNTAYPYIITIKSKLKKAASNLKRADILDKAKQTICHDRNDQYGEPEDNFGKIAQLWNAYFGTDLKKPLTSVDVADMMILFKVARNQGKPKEDNWVDICGYSACGGEVADGSSSDD